MPKRTYSKVGKIRRGTPGKPNKFCLVRRALRLLNERKYCKKHGLPALSLQEIASRSGYFSRTTPWRFERKKMGKKDIILRSLAKRRTKLVSDKKEQIIGGVLSIPRLLLTHLNDVIFFVCLCMLGWVIYRELTHASTTTTNFQEFISSYFGKEVSPSWITRYMERKHFSLKLPSNARVDQLKDATLNEAVQFLKSVNEFARYHKISPAGILVIDKMSLFSSQYHKHTKHIATKGPQKIAKSTPTRGPAHILYTGLKGDGTRCPFFVQSTDKTLALTQPFPSKEGTHLSPSHPVTLSPSLSHTLLFKR